MEKKILMLGFTMLVMGGFSACATNQSEQHNEQSDQTSQASCRDCGEDKLQKGEGINGNLPDIEYTYEGIVNGMTGIYQRPDVMEDHVLSKDAEWRSKVAEELKKVQPLGEDASEEQIQHLFKQMIYTVGMDFPAIEDSSRFGYLVFQKDMVNPFTKQKLAQEAGNVNIEIVLDASGSMENKIGGKTMMEIAKESIAKVLDNMPANVNVGLRIFGHRGDNSDSTKQESCSANELIVPIEKLNKERIESELSKVKPAGWTSIAKSIENGKIDLAKFTDSKDLNILYILTDGVETCDGNPIEEAKKINEKGTNVVLGIIGFNVDANQNKLLKQIADTGKGYYSSANDADKLVSELYTINELAYSKYEWENLGTQLLLRVEASQKGGLNFNKINSESYGITDLNTLNTAIQIGYESTDRKDFKYANLYKFGGKVETRLKQLANERREKIDKIYKDKIAEVEKQIDDYLTSIKARKGETVAYIPSTSRRDIRSAYYEGHKIKGGTTDSEKADKEKLREEQTNKKE